METVIPSLTHHHHPQAEALPFHLTQQWILPASLLHNKSLEAHLDLRSNCLQDDGVKLLCDAFGIQVAVFKTWSRCSVTLFLCSYVPGGQEMGKEFWEQSICQKEYTLILSHSAWEKLESLFIRFLLTITTVITVQLPSFPQVKEGQRPQFELYVATFHYNLPRLWLGVCCVFYLNPGSWIVLY